MHEEVLFLAVHRVGKVVNGFGGTEVEFSFDFEDFSAGGGFSKVGFREGEDFFLWRGGVGGLVIEDGAGPHREGSDF